MNIPNSYELIEETEIPEIGAHAYRLSHRKTHAHLILLDAADDNKVFSVTFRTRPTDDTGAPHIMEHSVLCGSARYPVKDPFMELAKGSLNTFLNAFTYPEKTMYPVASTNEKDFNNLMSVYMDAVFYPNIYKTDKIFMQEGWHYELPSPDAELQYNGVVYNEMRGAFSDPDSVLERASKALLFPDTTYAHESGGDPQAIPDLSYEDFLAFHKRCYSPSNAYICLYGDMDYTERLTWLDSEYLSHFDAIDPDSEIEIQAPFSEMKEEKVCYGISEGEDEDEHTFSWSKVVGGMFDPVETLAFEVLGYALLNANGAPVKKALLDAGIGADIYGGFDSGYRQCVFNVTAQGASPETYGDFKRIIEDTLKDCVSRGIPKKTLFAGINNIEFSLREADYGRYPKGLIYAMQLNDTWLFDEEKAFVHLKYNESFEKLKALAETDYFEKLITERLIVNTHGVLIDLTPVKGYTQKLEQKTAEKLAVYKASLTEEKMDALVKKTRELKEYQDTPSTEEELLSIPLLSVEDIEKKPRPLENDMREIAGIPALFHEMTTSGIVYLSIRFDVRHIAQEDLRYLALLKALYTDMDTEKFSYGELSDEISLYLGGLGCDLTTYTNVLDPENVREEFSVSGRAVNANVSDLFRLIEEIVNHTVFTDTKHLREIIGEMKAQMQQSMVSAGHATALKRVLSYSSAGALTDDGLIGIGYYKFIEDLEENFDARKEALAGKLTALSKEIFAKENAVIDITAEEEGFRTVCEEAAVFLDTLPEKTLKPAGRTYSFERKNEGFKTSSQVQYAAAGGSFRKYGFSYTGALRVLRTIMNTEYLWNRLRVKGGAYGCMSFFGRNGEAAFVSYRDPNLKETIETYRSIPEYLENFTVSDRDMTKYIIGTVSEMDIPLQPAARGMRSLSLHRGGVSYEMLEKERSEVLSCTAADIRALAPLVRAVLSEGLVCVVGSEAKIEENRALFDTVKLLTGEENE